jgi:ubiquinone/menaquinone biosynthesis C-methylase UbiE
LLVSLGERGSIAAWQSEADYVWGTGVTEQQRLLQQIELYVPEASWLLDQLEIKPGSRAIDLGCGPLGILDLLSKKIGPQGEVGGVEWESRFVELAKDLLAQRKLENVKSWWATRRPRDWPTSRFIWLTSACSLIVVPDPMKVISEMVRLTQRGGVVVVEDVDISSGFANPLIRHGRVCSQHSRLYMDVTARICGSVGACQAF